MKLGINEMPGTIMAEARAKISALYPPGTLIRVKFRPNWRADECKVIISRDKEFLVRSMLSGKQHWFYPGCHPHKIIKKMKGGVK